MPHQGETTALPGASSPSGGAFMGDAAGWPGEGGLPAALVTTCQGPNISGDCNAPNASTVPKVTVSWPSLGPP